MRDLIDSQYDQESFSLSMAAEQIGMSPNYLSTIFSQNMQQTFIEYVTEKRIEKAKNSFLFEIDVLRRQV